MIYKLKRYSKSTIPMRKPDIKFRNNKQEYNNLEEQENEEEKEELDYEEPQENLKEDYYIVENKN